MTTLAELTEIIDSCYTIFMSEISEPEQNVLRLVLQEAEASPETVSHNIGGTVIENLHPVEPTERSRTFELKWKQYIAYSGPKVGWANIDPGTRYSTYTLPQYKKAAGAFAGITLASINGADPDHPTDASVSVPYVGVQFVDEPWFIALGTEVSNQISAAIAGTESVTQALQTSQQDATTTVRQAGLLK